MHRIEAKGVAGQLFAEEVRYVTHGLTHPLGRSLERMGLSRRDVCRSLLSGRVDPRNTHGRHTEFLRILDQQEHYQLELEGTETG